MSSAPSAHPYASQPSLRFAEELGHKTQDSAERSNYGSGNGGGDGVYRLSRSASLKSSNRNQGLFSKGSSYR